MCHRFRKTPRKIVFAFRSQNKSNAHPSIFPQFEIDVDDMRLWPYSKNRSCSHGKVEVFIDAPCARGRHGQQKFLGKMDEISWKNQRDLRTFCRPKLMFRIFFIIFFLTLYCASCDFMALPHVQKQLRHSRNKRTWINFNECNSNIYQDMSIHAFHCGCAATAIVHAALPHKNLILAALPQNKDRTKIKKRYILWTFCHLERKIRVCWDVSGIWGTTKRGGGLRMRLNLDRTRRRWGNLRGFWFRNDWSKLSNVRKWHVWHVKKRYFVSFSKACTKIIQENSRKILEKYVRHIGKFLEVSPVSM